MDAPMLPRWIELRWQVTGDRIPSDHNYRLYSALVANNPALKEINWQLGTINGIPSQSAWIQLGNQSRISVRCQIEHLEMFAKLDNQVLQIGKALIQLGAMEGNSLGYCPCLRSRIVTFNLKHGHPVEPFDFGVSLGRQLSQLGIGTKPILGLRRCLRIKNADVVGYEVSFDCLNEVDSMQLQIHGLGGRRRMGCGVFYANKG